MSKDAPFDPHNDAPLLSAYVDGELGPRDAARVEAYLAGNSEARDEVEQLRRLKGLTDILRLKEAPPEDWEAFWDSVYNRVERSLGWILFLLGATIFASWGGWQLARNFLAVDTLPGWVKGAVMVGIAGGFVLLVSVIRERIFKRSRTRYKDVIR